MSRPKSNVPWWFIVVLLVMALPMIAWPWVMGAMPENNENGTLVMCFPIYALLSLYLAYRSFSQRPTVAWVLLAVLLIAYVAAGALAWVSPLK